MTELSSERPQVLLVDDHPGPARNFQAVMPDVEIVAAYNVERATEILTTSGRRISLVITDLMIRQASTGRKQGLQTGLDVIAMVTEKRPEISAMLLTTEDETNRWLFLHAAFRLFPGQLSALLAKGSPLVDLAAEVRSGLQGYRKPEMRYIRAANHKEDIMYQLFRDDDAARWRATFQYAEYRQAAQACSIATDTIKHWTKGKYEVLINHGMAPPSRENGEQQRVVREFACQHYEFIDSPWADRVAALWKTGRHDTKTSS